MFTDIQGYTALMQQDEQRALEVRNKHRRVFNEVTEKYGGRVLQYYGDGTLSMFDSILAAVECGIGLQRGFRAAPAIPVRIGIHSGEVLVTEEDIIGDSVNIAARIEALAVPGSVLISGKVHGEVNNQAAIRTVPLGAFRLKNVAQPVELYAVANDGLVVPPAEEIAGKAVPAETSASPSRPAATPFLATKLFVPPPRPGAVARARLLERLNAGLAGKLTLLSAPAGFGKTTLAAEWGAQCSRPVAWLSLDEGDGELPRFLGYLTAALRTVAPGFGERILGLLQSVPPPPPETLLTALLNEVAALPAPVVLVLDDYHLVDARPVDEALAFLLDHLPPTLHLAITTREDPNLPLARLRARGRLTELRAADLRFTIAEATDFLRQMMGLELPAAAIEALEARTEGWIAGLQMAALSLQGRADAEDFIRAFTGSHRFVLDYLAEEVLQGQPEETRRFLLQTAILDKLCGSLCDALTGRDDSRRRLEALERANLFVIPLDEERRWYRYHHLFADVLRARLLEERPGEALALHRRASAWYEKNGMTPEAIGHALAAEDYEQSSALLEMAWPAMDEHFRSAAWLAWARQLPEELVRVRPVLLTDYAWAYLNGGELEAGEERLRQAEQLLDDPKGTVVIDEEQYQSLSATIAIARIYLAQARGDVAATADYAHQALDQLPADDHIRRGQAAALLGMAHWAGGELALAHQALADTMDHFLTAGIVQYAISVTYAMADLLLAQGRRRAAVRTYEQSLQLALGQGSPVPRGTADLYLGLGDLAREAGALAAAEEQLQKSEELGLLFALPDWPCRLYIARARLAEAMGDPAKALALLDEAERLNFRSPVPDVRPIAARKAQLLARHGRVGEAEAWARASGVSPDDDLHFLREFEHATLARILIARYGLDQQVALIGQAMRLLTRLLEAAEAGDRPGSLIELLILQALGYEAQDDLAAALPPLQRALLLAKPEGYCRIFVDEGPPMRRLLVEAADRGIAPAYVRRLLAAFPAAPPPESERAPLVPGLQPLIEPLSERELEILRLIAEGLSNRQIGERLFLALSTVKGHNRNIFDKLDVKRRTEAVARARELGML